MNERFVVDSSIWIDVVAQRDGPKVETLQYALLENPTLVLLSDLVIHEVLKGVRGSKNRRELRVDFALLPQVEMVNSARAQIAAERYAILREQGITIRSSIDTLIASYCIDEDLPLLFTDRDFLPFVTHFGLRAA